MNLTKWYEIKGYEGAFGKSEKINCYVTKNKIKISLPLASINDPKNFREFDIEPPNEKIIVIPS